MSQTDELVASCVQFSFIYIPDRTSTLNRFKLDPMFGFDAVTNRYPIYHFVDFFTDIQSVVDWLTGFKDLPPTRPFRPVWMPVFVMKDDVIEVDSKTGYVYGRMDHWMLGEHTDWINGGYPIGKVEEVYL